MSEGPVNPIWMPEGSVRALVTLLTLCVSLIILSQTGNLPPELSTILGTCLGFYFAKAGEKK